MSTLPASHMTPAVSAPQASAPVAPATPAKAPASPASFGLAARRPRISPKMVFIFALLSLPFVYFAYVVVDQSLSRGVKDHGSYVEVDLKSMGFFPFDAASDDLAAVPEQFRNLDGRRVVLEGEMYADDTAGPTVKYFQLVYSVQKCCFGGPPKVQERVFCKVPDSMKVRNYTYNGQVRVVGKLNVEARRDMGQVVSLYEMEVESVEPI